MSKMLNECKIPEKVVPILVGGGLGLATAYYLTEVYSGLNERRRLTVLRERKKQQRRKQFEDLGLKYSLNEDYSAIVSLPFEELVSKLQKRELKAREVLEAYVAKALAVTNKFNCVTEFAPKCFELADELDALPEPKGPLHGIPICIKEDHDVEGMDTTLGFSMYLHELKGEHAVIVQILEDAGAVPFCKTNLPQTIFSSASDNPIYGTTVNPLNKALSPCGSSSGTGCLVGAGGALFGLGSDLGGSVRGPAHFCGISSLRSTIGRLSGRGIKQCLEDCAGYTGVSGVMANTATTLASVYKAITEDATQNKYDPCTVPVPWDSKQFNSKTPLRIGYYTSIPVFPSIGDTPGTILKAKAALEAMGHTVIPFDLPDSYRIVNVFCTLATADGGNMTYEKLKHDEVSYVAEKFMVGRTWLSFLYLKLTSLFATRSKRQFGGDPAAQKSEVLWEYLYEQRQIKYKVLDMMQTSNLDLLLGPVYPYSASTLEDTEALFGGVSYTCPYSLLDFPAGVVPFGKETCTKIDEYDDEGDYFMKLVKKGIRSAKGMPIGVQLIGKPFKEETVLRVLTELEDYKTKNKL